jgi:hypothetical protein
MADYPAIHGADELSRRLGGWPSFHDAEVIDFCARRSGESSLTLRLAQTAEQTVVEFVLVGVVGLEVMDFNEQNVIGSLDVEPEGDGVVLRLWPCYGFNGWIKARSVSVRVRSPRKLGAA